MKRSLKKKLSRAKNRSKTLILGLFKIGKHILGSTKLRGVERGNTSSHCIEPNTDSFDCQRRCQLERIRINNFTKRFVFFFWQYEIMKLWINSRTFISENHYYDSQDSNTEEGWEEPNISKTDQKSIRKETESIGVNVSQSTQKGYLFRKVFFVWHKLYLSRILKQIFTTKNSPNQTLV